MRLEITSELEYIERNKMLKIRVKYTTTDMVEIGIMFSNPHTSKEIIEDLLYDRYNVSKGSLMVVDVTTWSSNEALSALASKVDWGYLYDQKSYIIAQICHLNNVNEQIKVLWLHVTQQRIIDDAIANMRMDICTIYENVDAVFQHWINEYSVPHEAGELIEMDAVFNMYYPSMEILADGSVICLNW